MDILCINKRIPFFQEILETKSGLDWGYCSDMQTVFLSFSRKKTSLWRKDPAPPNSGHPCLDHRCHQLTRGTVQLPSWGEGTLEQEGCQTWSGRLVRTSGCSPHCADSLLRAPKHKTDRREAAHAPSHRPVLNARLSTLPPSVHQTHLLPGSQGALRLPS